MSDWVGGAAEEPMLRSGVEKVNSVPVPRAAGDVGEEFRDSDSYVQERWDTIGERQQVRQE